MWIYTGGPGEFIPGVPARDLTDEEADVFKIDKNCAIYKKASRMPAQRRVGEGSSTNGN